MIEIILFILPTFLSLIMHDYLNTKEKNLYSIVKTFAGYCCLNNLIMMTILFIHGSKDFYITENIQKFGFIFKYLTLSSILGIILPIVIEFIKRNVKLKFVFKEVNYEENN